MPRPSEPTALYRLYDSQGRLLYVGIATSPERRWLQHAAEKVWWPAVSRRDTEWFPSRAEAAAAEITAIRSERPCHNEAHTAPIPAPRAASSASRPLKRHEEIAADLRQQILNGVLPAGSRLPSESTLMASYDAARSTARQALDTLRQEGLAQPRHGAGVFVTHPEDRTVSVPVGRPHIAAERLRAALDPSDRATLARLLSPNE
jgi:DNA-binding transcriptional regulator YhcF (GntR family)